MVSIDAISLLIAMKTAGEKSSKTDKQNAALIAGIKGDPITAFFIGKNVNAKTEITELKDETTHKRIRVELLKDIQQSLQRYEAATNDEKEKIFIEFKKSLEPIFIDIHKDNSLVPQQ